MEATAKVHNAPYKRCLTTKAKGCRQDPAGSTQQRTGFDEAQIDRGKARIATKSGSAIAAYSQI
jgi:hypothetical protein